MSCPVCGSKRIENVASGIQDIGPTWSCLECGESCRRPDEGSRASGGIDFLVGLAILMLALCAVLVCLA
jgi:hypothetical protein